MLSGLLFDSQLYLGSLLYS